MEVGCTDSEEQQHCRNSLGLATEDNSHKVYFLEQLVVQQIRDSPYYIRNLKQIIMEGSWRFTLEDAQFVVYLLLSPISTVTITVHD